MTPRPRAFAIARYTPSAQVQKALTVEANHVAFRKAAVHCRAASKSGLNKENLMFTKTFVATKAASIKTSVDEVHGAIQALPDGPEKDELVAKFDRLHAKLNGAASKIAEVYETDISVFSGGTGKPLIAEDDG